MGALLDLASRVRVAPDASPSLTVGWRWRITPADGPSFEAFYSPDASLDEVEREYPGARVEPIPAQGPSRSTTEPEADVLRRLVAVVYAEDNETDRAEALATALADAESALTCYRDILSRSSR